MTGAEPAIDVHELGKSYGGRAVVDGVTFEVAGGEIVAVLGPNGAGKTTTVEIIEGYRRRDRGEVRVLGVDPERADRDHRARVGLMLQGGWTGGGGVDPRLTAREAIELYAAFHDRPRDVDEVLGMVGLNGDAATRTRYRRLSGGERQRVGLGLAIVGRPEVLILDEPSAGLDVEARAGVRELLRQTRDDGVAVLLTSHDLADVERVVDRVVIVDHGRVLVAGPLDHILGTTSPGLSVTFASDLDAVQRGSLAERIRHVSAAARLTERPDLRHVHVTDAEPAADVLAAITAWAVESGVTIVTIGSGGDSLEDRYLDTLRAAGDRS